MKLEKVTADMLGSAKKVTISKDDTIILDGIGDKKAIEERCEQVLFPFIILSGKNKERLSCIWGNTYKLRVNAKFSLLFTI
mgnify:FL=1